MTKHKQTSAPANGDVSPRGASVEDAELTNRASHICNKDGFRLLRYGIDSLYLSFPGTLDSLRAEVLARLKGLARSDEPQVRASAIYYFNDHQFSVSAGGSQIFSYVLSNHAYRIQISSPSSKLAPLAYVQIKSDWLVSQGVEDAVSDITALIKHLGEVSGPTSVSRVDVFADYVSAHALDSWSDDAWVTRSRPISTYKDGRVFTGWTIGAGADLSFRLYNKTEEIKKSGKDYLKAIWADKGWKSDQVVKRAEFQLKNAALARLHLNHYDDFSGALATVWCYCTDRWLRLTLPQEDDQTRSRWPLHPDWMSLGYVPWVDINLPVDHGKPPHTAPNDDWFFTTGLAPLTSYMAAQGIDDPDFAVYQMMDRAREYHNNKGFVVQTYYEDYMYDKAAIKATKYGLPFPGVGEKAREVAEEVGTKAYKKKRDGSL